MDFIGLVIGLIVGAALGALATALIVQRRAASVPQTTAEPVEDPAIVEARHQMALSELRASEQQVQSTLRSELSGVEATVDGLREQIETAKAQYREVLESHRAEAQVREQRERTEQQAREERERAESKVLQALAPVKQSLTDMQSKVAQLESQRTLQHGELTQQLRQATESEERLRATAETLASALRSNSTRGVWGETQLRSVVEAAGLLERVDFDTQASISTDAGAGRPDMVIHLPGGKNIAVDAKVPFNSYLEASQIPATATGAEGTKRETLMKAHVKAVRDHITTLGGKTYWNGLASSPELVIAFIPSESLVSSALEADPSIMEFAFSKRVALASPVTLWSVLKTVAFSWQQDVLTNEAKTLFDLSRELYSRLSTTATQIDKLGRTIERTVKDYNSFVGSLESRVLPTARKLGALDESKVFAPLKPIEEPRRELTAFELVGALDEAEPREAISASDPLDSPDDLDASDDFDELVESESDDDATLDLEAEIDPEIRSI